MQLRRIEDCKITFFLEPTEVVAGHAALVVSPDVVEDHVAVVDDGNVAVEHSALQLYHAEQHVPLLCCPEARFSSLWR